MWPLAVDSEVSCHSSTTLYRKSRDTRLETCTMPNASSPDAKGTAEHSQEMMHVYDQLPLVSLARLWCDSVEGSEDMVLGETQMQGSHGVGSRTEMSTTGNPDRK